MREARIVVVGNEKGGSGKSTVAMHLIVAMLTQGARVASLDLDARQGTLTRYIEHRRAHSPKGSPLALPEHLALAASGTPAIDEARLTDAMTSMARRHEILVIDTPGSDQPLSRIAHSYADLLVTPLNDSLLDLDPLAQVNPLDRTIGRPGPYAEMVWEAKKRRAMRRQRPTDWFVLRNRLSALDARNKREMERLLGTLAARIGFHLLGGLSERVVFRELFLEGLTLLDLGGGRSELTLSQVAARQELRHLVDGLGLGGIGARSTAGAVL